MYISICNNEIHILYVRTRYRDVTLIDIVLAIFVSERVIPQVEQGRIVAHRTWTVPQRRGSEAQTVEFQHLFPGDYGPPPAVFYG